MKLSICIPTFQRLDYALKQVCDIKEKFDKFKYDYEILVSDNCSNKSSKLISLEKFCYLNSIIFFKQKRNLGLIGNINFLLNKAEGEYVWFLGDDDFVKERTTLVLEKIFDNFKANYIFLNHAAVKGRNRSEIFKRFNLNDVCGFHENALKIVIQMFKDNGAINMFMSSNIYKKKNLINAYKKYSSKQQIVDPFIYSILTSKKSAYIEKKICIYDNFEQTSWKNNKRNVLSRIFVMRLFDLVENNDINRKELKQILNPHFNEGVGNIFFFLWFANEVERKKVFSAFKTKSLLQFFFNGLLKVIRNLLLRLNLK